MTAKQPENPPAIGGDVWRERLTTLVADQYPAVIIDALDRAAREYQLEISATNPTDRGRMAILHWRVTDAMTAASELIRLFSTESGTLTGQSQQTAFENAAQREANYRAARSVPPPTAEP